MNAVKKIKDKDIYIIIGNTLRWGVFLSMGVAVIGGIVYLTKHGHETNTLIGQKFSEQNENVGKMLRDTFHGILKGHGYYIIELGVLLLIATPLARVIFSLIAFAFEKDKLYVGVTFLVLVIIIVSMMTGFGG